MKKLAINKKSYIKIILITWVLCTFVFVSLKIIAYSFPDKWVENNVRISAAQLIEEGAYPRVIESLAKTQRDNYTERYILGMASHRGDHPIEAAFLDPYYECDPNLEWPPAERIISAAEGIGKGANESYGRYWQGHIVFERPLLAVMTLRQIYILMAVMLLAADIWTSIRIARRLGIGVAVIFNASLLLADVWMVPLSTKYFYSFIIAVIATGVVCKIGGSADNAGGGACDDSGSGKRLAAFFFAVGAVTVYLDFISTPLVTMIYPLATLLLMNVKRGGTDDNTSDPLKSTSRYMLLWIAGYILLGITNWVFYSIASALKGEDGIYAISTRFMMWTGSDGLLMRFYGIKRVIETIISSESAGTSVIAAVLVAVLVIMTAPYFISRLADRNAETKPDTASRIMVRKSEAALFLLGVLPFVWWIILSRSVTDHAYAVYRTAAALYYTIILEYYILIHDSFLKRIFVLDKTVKTQ